MIREIVTDPIFLAQPSQPATEEDRATAQDLLDTLAANHERCVGLAANMIGVLRRVIVFDHEGVPTVMYNPVILKGKDSYETEEGCLSLTGLRKTRRWRSVKVQYQNDRFETRIKTFHGYSAQIIQHEVDHCEGIII
ncbi:MAG: peptide deformylase [Clostridia bacterium]|nr:peptide deformylase [Clostridia bacterium]